jgi:hypothetical protein
VTLQTRAGKPFLRARAQIVYKFQEKNKFFRVPIKDFEENNKDLETSKIIYNYFIIINIINAYYNYIVQGDQKVSAHMMITIQS